MPAELAPAGKPLPKQAERSLPQFCSECGQSLSLQWVADEGRERLVCTACGTIHYENPRVIVSTIVHCRASVLMCRRAREPARGEWSLPSGFLECGETLEEGAARETFEESGVLINPSDLELYAVMNMPDINQIAVSFRIEVRVEPALMAGPECLEVAFLSEQDTLTRRVAWRDSMGDSGNKFFSELRTRKFSILLATLRSGNEQSFRSRGYPISADRSRLRR